MSFLALQCELYQEYTDIEVALHDNIYVRCTVGFLVIKPDDFLKAFLTRYIKPLLNYYFYLIKN